MIHIPLNKLSSTDYFTYQIGEIYKSLQLDMKATCKKAALGGSRERGAFVNKCVCPNAYFLLSKAQWSMFQSAVLGKRITFAILA